MKKKEMITYSGEELMQMELPPVRFVVKDFLSQGLNILAGQAKVGKSWMMLDLCIKVAKGEKFFGFDTEKSTVLYLCLEDSPNRIRDRMVKLTDAAPANLHFAVMADNLAGDRHTAEDSQSQGRYVCGRLQGDLDPQTARRKARDLDCLRPSYEKEIGQGSVQYGVGFDRNHRRCGQHLRDENGRFLLGFRKALYARQRYSRESFDHSI